MSNSYVDWEFAKTTGRTLVPAGPAADGITIVGTKEMARIVGERIVIRRPVTA